ncbi:ABC transporter substrate-binding protein [Desulfosarcina ovata]|uniref:ABC transporter substrate-binding protein n=1 Tax=Desulfosarcina ovata TaxID=83564 RepID=UPI001E3481BC|nr:ABC transporter substrate-binding protein [Desulfosarcina ovata]
MKGFALLLWMGLGAVLAVFPMLTFAEDGASLVIATPFGPAVPVPDPAKGSNGWYTSEAGVTETLLRIDFDMRLVPWLAKSYRNIDPLTWEIELRSAVLFHDRTPLDATAVKWSIMRLIDEKSAVFNKRVQQMLDIDTITVVDDQILRFRTRRPNAAFLSALASPDTASLSPRGKMDYVYGTGPFVLRKVIPKEEMVMSRFSGYWGTPPQLERVCLKMIQNPATRMLAFEAGQVDVAASFPENDARRIVNREHVDIVSHPTNRLCFFFVRVKDGPLADGRIRRAINYAIDRRQIVETVLAGIGGSPAGSIFPQILPWNNPELAPCPHDPGKAAQLLEEAGARDSDGDGILEINGRPLSLNMWTYDSRPSLKPTLELVQAQLAACGIASRLKVTRRASPINLAMQRGDVHLNLQMWNTAPQGDPDFFITSILTRSAGSNVMGYANRELDDLAEKGKTTVDPEKRKAIYNRIQQIVFDESPVIVLFHKSMVSAVYDHVENYRIHPAEKYIVTPELGRR